MSALAWISILNASVSIGAQSFSILRGGFNQFQPIKIAKRSYWLNVFCTKLKSVLTENDNIISMIDADIISVDILNLVSCFPSFRKSVFLNLFKSAFDSTLFSFICLLSNRAIYISTNDLDYLLSSKFLQFPGDFWLLYCDRLKKSQNQYQAFDPSSIRDATIFY